MKRALLVLEDGTFCFGESLAAEGEVYGELVFNTAMTGYQELLTDPSYTNQIVVMTYPEIGIYGVNEEDIESDGVKVKGFVVFRMVEKAYNYRATKSLIDYLKENGTMAIQNVDTRSLTRKIRSQGTMKGAISTIDLDPKSLLEKVKRSEPVLGIDLVKEVSCHESSLEESSGPRVAVIDCGVKFNILRELKKRGLSILKVPYTIDFEELKKFDVKGVLISNGPGDPSVLVKTIDLVRKILKHNLPVAGICLGHQLLALAIGARTYKMKFGHRGVNHPVKDLERNKVLITTHNHGFAVEPSSLKLTGIGQTETFQYENLSYFQELLGESPAGFGKVKVTHVSLNDGTIEGMRLLDYPAFSVQFHPEACPGPHDANFFFDDFMKLIEGR
ncbi:MAG: Carbamoyl-phosphate synthase small chain [Thermotoga sp. 50_1627]|uniref:glutamine-hydrolyzing carbamoyl-phosphate synthase small subunit n=1 Tax=Pseudothermotoga sp. TaxID=2033661 RepID=UPI00076CD35A|nr:MAG: Carbamoyl-phosphate synthase small chain [Thermotoga sp. 50_64]KUK24277.1 MAG: Carbamoyl-phosphate synthase small chain [Thermotoga sp. 50_1627]MBC7117149.1 glutamine-hydrolyzing carbamoyl-phosphate synthase small subunit [Pseudothermotoga sp.]MDK2922906.1 carbamoyl-phosphate synthase small subunit [Pseudothermotoga sp.]